MLTKRFFILFVLLSVPLLGRAECINVNGISFEKIDSTKLLVTKDDKNIAIIHTYFMVSLPSKIGAFRFFSEKLCDSGAENKFHIDGKLFNVDRIELFK